MTATAILFPPKTRGYELTPEEIESEIRMAGVSYGILDKVVTKMADEKIEYKEMVVARAKQPVHGQNAEIKMYFDPNGEKTVYRAIAEDKFDFAKKLKFEVTTDNNQKISTRIDFASQNSWEARAVQFGEIIKQLI